MRRTKDISHEEIAATHESRAARNRYEALVADLREWRADIADASRRAKAMHSGGSIIFDTVVEQLDALLAKPAAASDELRVHPTAPTEDRPAPEDCFWKQCSDKRRCAAFGKCVARYQNENKDRLLNPKPEPPKRPDFEGMRRCAALCDPYDDIRNAIEAIINALEQLYDEMIR